jgi:hypothetical protein
LKKTAVFLLNSGGGISANTPDLDELEKALAKNLIEYAKDCMAEIDGRSAKYHLTI